MRRFTQTPNYGRQKVDRVPSSTSVAGVVGLGKHAGPVPADRRGARNSGVRVRGGR